MMFLHFISVSLLFATVYYVFSTVLGCIHFFSVFIVDETKDWDDNNWRLLLYDLGLIAIFIVQHSLMVSHYYKDTIGCRLGAHQRCVYTLASGLSLKFLFEHWQPVNSIVIWSCDLGNHPLLALFFSLMHMFAWTMLILQHVMIEPWCLIGIKQIYYSMRRNLSPFQYMSQHLQHLIEHLPHPGMLCFLIILWMCPHLTIDRWLVSTLLTWYICLQSSVTHKDYRYTEKQVVIYCNNQSTTKKIQ